MKINRITSWKDSDQLSMNSLNNEIDNVVNEINKNNRVKYVTDFGATGNGTANDSAAIQSAHDAIVASGVPGILRIPSGTYSCASGLSINVSYVSVQGDNAVLDFSTVTTGAAITVYGDTNNSFGGNPFYNTTHEISGLVITGNSFGGSVKGIKFSTATGTMAPAHITIRNCVVNHFATGYSIEDGGYLIRFVGSEAWDCTLCISAAAASDSGEEVSFHGCAFYNSTNGFNLSNANADYNFYGCSFDGMDDTYISVSAGMANFNNCHFEGNFGTGHSTSTKWFNVPAEGGGDVSYVSFNECLFLLKQAQAGDNLTVPVFGVYGNARLHLYGSQVLLSGNATITGATGFIESTAGVVDLLVLNTTFIGNASIYGTLTNVTQWLADFNSDAVVSSRGFVVGKVALATNATKGFLYIPTCAGTPTGTPATQTGTVPLVWDHTNKKFYIYDGAWLGGTNPGAFT